MNIEILTPKELKRFIKKNKLDQRKICEIMGMNKTSTRLISEYINGKRKLNDMKYWINLEKWAVDNDLILRHKNYKLVEIPKTDKMDFTLNFSWDIGVIEAIELNLYYFGNNAKVHIITPKEDEAYQIELEEK